MAEAATRNSSTGPDEGRASTPARQGNGRTDRVGFRLASDFSLAALLVIALVAFSVASPDAFATGDNYRGIAVAQVTIVFAAIALLAPLIVGELDLSVGYVIGLSQAVVVGLMSKQGIAVPLAIALTLVACSLVGLANGLLVVRLGINSLIVTLAVGSILYGIVLWYTGGNVITDNIPQSFQNIANNEVLTLPLAIWYGLGLLLVFEVFLGFKPMGRRMYAIGGNRRAAELVGIRVKTIIVISFVIAAVVAGIGGILVASRLGSAQPELGPEFLLPAYASVFLGATTIRPGRFNPAGTVIAVYLVAVVVSGLQTLGVASWAQYMVDGAALIIGVALANALVRLREERARREQLRAFAASAEEVNELREEIGGRR